MLIPASNEEARIDTCLEALLAQEEDAGLAAEGVEVVVAANACRDATAARSRAFTPRFAARGWRLAVLDIPEPGKPNALNRADAEASGPFRLYLDADVTCGGSLLAKLRAALDRPEPRYASGRLTIAPARSWITQRYAALWARLPFMRTPAPGAGLFAVNAAGRARWGAFPGIISDDTYVRLLFAPSERIEVDADYVWPMVEGLANLIRVRRRQDAGVAEVYRLWPELGRNEGKDPVTPAQMVGLFLETPLAFCVYASVALTVRLTGRAGAQVWARGR